MDPALIVALVIGAMALVVVVGRLVRGPLTPQQKAKDRRTRGNSAGWFSNNNNL